MTHTRDGCLTISLLTWSASAIEGASLKSLRFVEFWTTSFGRPPSSRVGLFLNCGDNSADQSLSEFWGNRMKKVAFVESERRGIEDQGGDSVPVVHTNTQTIAFDKNSFSRSLWRRPAVCAHLKWTAMTVGPRSMDSHTTRRRNRDHCQDNQWVRRPVTGMRNPQPQRGLISAGLR